MLHVTLVELPTFPKGTIGLSLPYLSGFLAKNYVVRIVDLNFEPVDNVFKRLGTYPHTMVGLKVSGQNHHIAERLSSALKDRFPDVPVVWGGEYPTLMPEKCAEFADTTVSGLFDPVADRFLHDLSEGSLQKRYVGNNDMVPMNGRSPHWAALPDLSRYNHFMGLPLETSRGCTESCTFCMVLTMQRKHYHTRPLEAIAADVAAIGRNLINIIDYNFGVSREHVVGVCDIIARSNALGFMAEMTLENLDDDVILAALGSSNCKMVYCGLESIDEVALKSVGKDRTNHIENYRRIIRKAQRAGINVASGFILGMEHSSSASYRSSLAFFKEMGIIYAKLTYLTFNPGTRSQLYYRKKGRFITEDPKHYDGNHLTFVPEGVSAEQTYEGTRWFIRNFYSIPAIFSRSTNNVMGWRNILPFILFNLCYREVYLTWMRENALREDWDSDMLLESQYRKGWVLRSAEWLLLLLWKAEKPSL